jgi:hypothetical protein
MNGRDSVGEWPVEADQNYLVDGSESKPIDVRAVPFFFLLVGDTGTMSPRKIRTSPKGRFPLGRESAFLARGTGQERRYRVFPHLLNISSHFTQTTE